MKLRLFCALFVVACTALAQSTAPDLGYKVDTGWPELPAGWNLKETPGVEVDARNHTYIFHRGPNSIIELNPDGKLVRSWGDGLFERPHSIRIDSQGNFWAVDDGGHTVLKMDAKGKVKMVLGRWRSSGETGESFNRPTDVAFAPSGEIYVSDGYGNSRVVKYTPDGKFLKAWGKKGVAEGEFVIPHAIAVDKKGRVYVGDRENRRIQIFDPEGKFLAQWKHVGSPWGFYMTPDQHLYMCDGYNGRVLKLNLEGQVLGAFGEPGKLPGQFAFAHHISVSPGGDIYVAEILNWRAQKFVRK